MPRCGVVRQVKSFVNGRCVVGGNSTKKFSLLNAFTAEPETVFFGNDLELVDCAVESARQGQLQWAAMAPSERGEILRRAASILAKKNRQIAKLETLDTGRPIAETSVVDVQGAVECLNYYAGVSLAMGGQTIDLPNNSWGYTRREPLGVTAGIGAWNYPLQSAVWKSAPALAFGNAMVFKPSEETPLTALELAEAYHDAGMPNGVFNVILGDGQVGERLVTNDHIAKVSFTGSMQTGLRVYQQAAAQLKKVTMELGGKSPLIVFDDADLHQAVSGAMLGNWYSNGQVCSNGTRVFVHKKIYDAFIHLVLERTKKLRIGDPLDHSTQIGPMINANHLAKVEQAIQRGIEQDDATLLYGGQRIESLRPGFFLTPAIFINCRDDMQLVQNEIFGMVMCILPFDNEDEVVTRANATEYGLAAGVFTQNLARAHRVVRNLHVGTSWINNYNLAPVELPWGGTKYSGIGRENGLAGVEAWTQIKSVYVEMNDKIDCPYD